MRWLGVRVPSPAQRPAGREPTPTAKKVGPEAGVEGYPSGQREQTVNLPAYAFEGSNPSPTTWVRKTKAMHGERRRGGHIQNYSAVFRGLRVIRGYAGVAQLVERKPSK